MLGRRAGPSARGWRHAALAGAAAGLAAAPHLPPPPTGALPAAAMLSVALGSIVAVRRDRSGGIAASVLGLGAVATLAVLAGALAGDARVAAIDRGAFDGDPGQRVAVRGFVSAVPRNRDGIAHVPLDTADGRLLVEAPQPDGEVRVGSEITAEGVVRRPQPWQAGRLRITGTARIVAAGAIASGSGERGGLAGAFDGIRDRAEAALERGVPDEEAALSRGFVLGQDDRIGEETVTDFRRSGLAHLLAVSGQNVLLLALLAFPLLGFAGIGLRARLLVVIALIVVYVPVTGAGPSIQRAAVMGVAGIVALLAGRPSLRWYALLLAAAATLAVNPRAAADVGWQLSFAAVVGILLWARPIARAALRRLARRGDGSRPPSALLRGLAEGVGMTTAATLATAPVSAIHFETVSLAALPANLLALPAVAPVMWLGMLSAALGQIPAIPVEPLNWVGSLLIAYIAQVADWLAAPGWAAVELRLPGPATSVPLALAAIALIALSTRVASRRAGLARRRSLAPAAALAALVAIALLAPLPAREAPAAGSGLAITAFDVGQGDSILLDPEPGGAVLVDTGPPGSGVADRLLDLGVGKLDAIVVTHDHLDHDGGLAEVLRTVPTGVVVHAGAGRRLRASARAAGAETRSVEEGAVLRAGGLSMRVLAPASAERAPGADPNERSIVLLARWRRFSALLTGDAEAEVAPVDPGRVDVLKVAHHGSEDGGLAGLLERIEPSLALISSGEDNPFGHPHPTTLSALADAGVRTLRTDLDGEISLEVEGGRIRFGD